jgi:hypothetical protein
MDDVQTFLQSKKLGYWSSNMYERIFAVSMTSRLVELQLIPTTLAPTTRFFKQKVLRPLNHKNLLKYQLYTSYNYESLVADFRICPVLSLSNPLKGYGSMIQWLPVICDL